MKPQSPDFFGRWLEAGKLICEATGDNLADFDDIKVRPAETYALLWLFQRGDDDPEGGPGLPGVQGLAKAAPTVQPNGHGQSHPIHVAG